MCSSMILVYLNIIKHLFYSSIKLKPYQGGGAYIGLPNRLGKLNCK